MNDRGEEKVKNRQVEILGHLMSLNDVGIIHAHGETEDGQQVIISNGHSERYTVSWDEYDKMAADRPITAHHDTGRLSFKMMTKPVSEGGRGCQVSILAHALRAILRDFQGKYASIENEGMIHHLNCVIQLDKARTARRIKEKTEGTNAEMALDEQ